jgi:hypothetical protein
MARAFNSNVRGARIESERVGRCPIVLVVLGSESKHRAASTVATAVSGVILDSPLVCRPHNGWILAKTKRCAIRSSRSTRGLDKEARRYLR